MPDTLPTLVAAVATPFPPPAAAAAAAAAAVAAHAVLCQAGSGGRAAAHAAAAVAAGPEHLGCRCFLRLHFVLGCAQKARQQAHAVHAELCWVGSSAAKRRKTALHPVRQRTPSLTACRSTNSFWYMNQSHKHYGTDGIPILPDYLFQRRDKRRSHANYVCTANMHQLLTGFVKR